MKKVFISLVLYLLAICSNAQQINIDSLVSTISYDSDTSLILELGDKAMTILELNGEEDAFSVASYMLQLSSKTGFEKGKVKWYFVQGKAHRLNREYDQANAYADSAYQVSETLNYTIGKAEALGMKGRLCFYTDEYEKGLNILKELVPIFDTLKDTLNLLIVHGNKAIMHDNLGDLPTAIEEYLISLRYAEQLNDTLKMSIITENLGLSHRKLEDYNQSLLYYQRALKMRLAINAERFLPKSYGHIGTAFKNLNNLDSAKWYYNLQLELSKKLAIGGQQALGLHNLGSIEFRKENYASAMKYYEASLTMKKKINWSRGSQINSLSNIATCNSRLGNLEVASDMYHEILQFYLDTDDLFEIIDTYHNLADTYEQAKNYEKAYKYSRLRYKYQDSLITSEKVIAIAELEKKYETAEKDRQIAQQDLEIQKKEAKVKDKENQLYGLGGASLLAIALASLFYVRHRAKQKIVLQEAINTEQKKGFTAVINATEEERKRIAKDLHDGIGQQLGALKLGLSHLENQISPEGAETKEEFGSLKQLVDETATDARNISHQMMPRTLTELGLVPAIQDSLEKSFGRSEIQYNFEHFNLKERYNESVEIALYRIVQELINNIIKHSGAKEVAVQLFQNAKDLILIVEDNGKGMGQQAKKGGLGLTNIRSRIDTLNGKIDYSPSPESGTVATVKVPVN